MPNWKCMSCGKVIKGTCFYCEGCSGYVCWECCTVDDTGTRTCPNCGSHVQQLTV